MDTTKLKYDENDSSGNMQIKKLYLDPFMDIHFFGLLKKEICYENIFHSYRELEQEIINYIHDRIKE